MTRRGFLTSVGGLLATELLPTLPAAGTPRATDPMTITYLSVPIGATRPFSVFHISDTHLRDVLPSDPPAQRAFAAGRFVGWDPEDALRASLTWVKNHRSDYVLHTGDLIDFVSEGNLALLRKYFGETANLLYAPGNHDYATTVASPRGGMTEADFRAMNTARVQAAVPVDMAFHAQVVNGVNFVMLDNVYGTIAAASVERFHEEAKKGLPIVLCCHVPLCTEGLWRACSRRSGGPHPFADNVIGAATGNFKTQLTDPTTSAFLAYLKREPLLKLVLCGHFHAAKSDDFSPTAKEYVVAANFRYVGQEIMFY